jgi:hypothetical protein
MKFDFNWSRHICTLYINTFLCTMMLCTHTLSHSLSVEIHISPWQEVPVTRTTLRYFSPKMLASKDQGLVGGGLELRREYFSVNKKFLTRGWRIVTRSVRPTIGKVFKLITRKYRYFARLNSNDTVQTVVGFVVRGRLLSAGSCEKERDLSSLD